MNSNKPENVDKTTSDCCTQEPNQPCPSSLDPNDSNCCASPHSSRYKIIIFCLVMFFALTAGAFSIYKKSSSNKKIDAEMLLGSGIKNDTAVLSIEGNSREIAGPSCGIPLDSIKALGIKAAGKDAVFLFLTGEKNIQGESYANLVETVVDKILSSGKRAAAFTLDKKAKGYDQLIEQFSIQSFPAIIVAGRGCQPIALGTSDITESNLLQAFVVASRPSSGCSTPCN